MAFKAPFSRAVKAPFYKSFLRFLANYLGHPLFMPLYAYGAYWLFNKVPLNLGFWINLIVIFSLLVAAPLFIYPLLLKAGKIKSIHLKRVQERIWPLGINLILWSCLVIYLTLMAPTFSGMGALPQSLNSFYIGGALCVLGALISARMRHKSSLHMMGITGLVTHLILAQTYFDPTPTFCALALFWSFGLSAIIGIGLVRYKSKAHSLLELITGFSLGLLTQIFGILIAIYR